MNKKLTALGMALILILFVLYFYVNSPPDANAEFVTYSLKKGDILVAVKTSGMVLPRQVIDINSPVNGIINALGADPDDSAKALNSGSRIRKGNVFAKVDNPTFAQEHALYQQNVNLAEAEVRQFQLILNNAQEAWNRLQESSSSQDDYTLDQSRVLLKMAQADLLVAQSKQKQAYAAEKLARVKLESTLIRSPIDGVVLDRLAEFGQTVAPGSRLFVISSGLDRMQIRAAVVEADINKIWINQKVYFTLDADPISRMTAVVSQKNLNANIINNIVTYDVISEIVHNQDFSMPYMTANIQFVIDERADVFKIPIEALNWTPHESEDGIRNSKESKEIIQRVWILDQDRLLPVEVTTGLTDGSFVEVSGEGLSANMQIVVGQKVSQSADFGSTILKSIMAK